MEDPTPPLDTPQLCGGVSKKTWLFAGPKQTSNWSLWVEEIVTLAEQPIDFYVIAPGRDRFGDLRRGLRSANRGRGGREGGSEGGVG